MTDVTVGPDEILTVTATPGSYGTVWLFGSQLQWTVGAKSPLRLGPGSYRIETVMGTVTHSVDSAMVAALGDTLPRATEIIQSARVVAAAIGDTSMLSDKFKRLADRARSVPAALADRADQVAQRWDAVEARSGTAFAGHEAVLQDAETGVAAAEDALHQLTNGAG